MACLPVFHYLDNSSCRVSSGRTGSLLDAEALAGRLVPAGSMFAFLAAHRAEVFPDADYADLFAPPGLACRRCRRPGWRRC